MKNGKRISIFFVYALASVCFFCAKGFAQTDSTDSLFFAKGLDLRIKAQINPKSDSVSIWNTQALKFFGSVSGTKYSGFAGRQMGLIFYEQSIGKIIADTDTVFNCPESDSATFRLKKTIASGYPTGEVYEKLALTQILQQQYTEALKNFALAVRMDRSQLKRDKAQIDFSKVHFILIEKSESSDTLKAKAFQRHIMYSTVVYYEIFPSAELAEYIYDTSLELGDKEIQKKFKAILKKEYGKRPDD